MEGRDGVVVGDYTLGAGEFEGLKVVGREVGDFHCVVGRVGMCGEENGKGENLEEGGRWDREGEEEKEGEVRMD